jgi:hypothetical protein
MIAQEPIMATVNQMMPLSGQPKRFSFHIETNDNAISVKPRITIIQRLKAINVRSVCTGLMDRKVYAVFENLTEVCAMRILANFARLAGCGSTPRPLSFASFHTSKPFRMWSGCRPRVSQMFSKE